MSANGSIEDFSESLKRYITTNIEIFKLEAGEKTSVIGSGIISGLIIGLAGLLFICLISIAAGFYISEKLGDNYSGFAIMAGFYLLLGLILFLTRKNLVERPIRDKIIRKLFSQN